MASLGPRINSLALRQNDRYFADDIFKGVCFNENLCKLMKIVLMFDPRDLIDEQVGTGLDNGLAPFRW